MRKLVCRVIQGAMLIKFLFTEFSTQYHPDDTTPDDITLQCQNVGFKVTIIKIAACRHLKNSSLRIYVNWF